MYSFLFLGASWPIGSQRGGNDMKLDARLAAVAAFVPQGSRVADIGTDHGYLAAALVEEGRAPFVIASDLPAGPCEAARRTVREEGSFPSGCKKGARSA